MVRVVAYGPREPGTENFNFLRKAVHIRKKGSCDFFPVPNFYYYFFFYVTIHAISHFQWWFSTGKSVMKIKTSKRKTGDRWGNKLKGLCHCL